MAVTQFHTVVLAGGGSGGNAGVVEEVVVEVLVVFVKVNHSGDPYTASPLNAPAGLTVSASPGSYPITVGAGGATLVHHLMHKVMLDQFNFLVQSLQQVEAQAVLKHANIGDGGSGGGAGAAVGPGARSGGSGNTPPVSPPQGNDGGDSVPSPNPGKNAGGGGGGAGAVGNNGDYSRW